MRIGPYEIAAPAVLAPMAGVTDAPFRRLCRELGAGLAVSEMVSCNPALRASRKHLERLTFNDETEPRAVQIVGADPGWMADAARDNVARGAQIIDINMGCPAKKVCKTAAGSALLRDETLVARILHAVVQAVDVPVTLKIRTGWDTNQRNGVRIARIAEGSGIQSLAVHGRTRACAFTGNAEYDTIAAIKQTVRIPMLANGDITTPEHARQVLDYTGADGVMIGRGALGRPWLFRAITHYLRCGQHLPEPDLAEVESILIRHLHSLYAHYGEERGVLMARKHVSWYSVSFPGGDALRHTVNQTQSAAQQLELVQAYFQRMTDQTDMAA